MAGKKKDKQAWILFIVTFLVSLIIITYFIKSMSPDVDVEIGGEHSQRTEEETDSDVKQAIDDRLRWIQMEDNLPGVSKRDELNNEEQINEQEENVKKPELAPIEYINPHTEKNKITTPPVPLNKQEPQVSEPVKQEPFKMSKVYVGSYATIEQAIQAQNNLMNATTTVSPFVKEVNGQYVLQAGSYTNSAKANALAKELNSLGFNANVVKE